MSFISKTKVKGCMIGVITPNLLKLDSLKYTTSKNIRLKLEANILNTYTIQD